MTIVFSCSNDPSNPVQIYSLPPVLCFLCPSLSKSSFNNCKSCSCVALYTIPYLAGHAENITNTAVISGNHPLSSLQTWLPIFSASTSSRTHTTNATDSSHTVTSSASMDSFLRSRVLSVGRTIHITRASLGTRRQLEVAPGWNIV